MRDTGWLCSLWYNNLHTEEYEVRNLLNAKFKIHSWSSVWCVPFSALFQLSADVLERFSNRGESEVLPFKFLTSAIAKKTKPFWQPAYQSDQASGVINWAVENKKSTLHKHCWQTWGRTMFQKRPAPIRNTATSSLLAPNCWWHQSSFPDCLVRDQASSAPMQSHYRENRRPRHTTSPSYRKAKDEDERDRVKKRAM